MLIEEHFNEKSAIPATGANGAERAAKSERSEVS
jgi:hypothetical protein